MLNTVAYPRPNCPAHPAGDGPRTCTGCERPRAAERRAILASPAAQAAWLALSDERDAALTRALAQWRAGYDAAVAELDGITTADLDRAYAAGQRHSFSPEVFGAFDAGWAACLDMLADHIGGRIVPVHPTALELKRWTRHAPRCRHGGHGGTVSCDWAGCLPGPRADFGKPAPWDKTGTPS